MLKEALEHEMWKDHKIGDTYLMDGKGSWKIAYYPLLECGKTGEVYTEPRVLVEQKAVWQGKEGTDFREVPFRYLAKRMLSEKDSEVFFSTLQNPPKPNEKLKKANNKYKQTNK